MRTDLSVEAQPAQEDIANALQILGIVQGHGDIDVGNLYRVETLLRTALKKLRALAAIQERTA